VLGITKQLGHTTSALGDIASDLGELVSLLRDRPSETHAIASFRRELISLNLNLGLQRDEVGKLRGTIKSLVDLQRSNWPKQAAQTEALTTALNTFSATMGQLSSVMARQAFPSVPNPTTPAGPSTSETTSTATATPSGSVAEIVPLLPNWSDTHTARRNGGPWRYHNNRPRRRDYRYGNQYKNLRVDRK